MRALKEPFAKMTALFLDVKSLCTLHTMDYML